MSNLDSATAAETSSTPAPTRSAAKRKAARPRSLAGDAWRDLSRSWIFWIAAVLVVGVVLMALFPTLFTTADPKSCALSRQHAGPTGPALFGFDFQGCDVYARTIYGARASVTVGVLATTISGLIGLVVGMLSGYFGGLIDALLSRVIDVVLGIPTLLAAIVLAKRLSADRQGSGIAAVVFTLGILGWTTGARIMRSSVISAKSQDFVSAARMLGASSGRIMLRHILPNSVAPFIVVLTILLGGNIAAEATLTFLGVGLNPAEVSWGIDIATGATHMREAVTPLVVPSVFLALTVLSFIMLGDAIRDAFDPRLR